MSIFDTATNSIFNSCLAEDADYSYEGSNTLTTVILDQEIERVNEFGISERLAGITFHKSSINKPRKGAMVTILGDIYTLGDVISDDGYSVLMEAVK